MSWRVQNVVSLVVIALMVLLNALPAHAAEKSMQHARAAADAYDFEYTLP